MIAGLLRKMADHPSTKQRKVKTVQKWKCDVCHVATFPTLDEACKHEEACQKDKDSREATQRWSIKEPVPSVMQIPTAHQILLTKPKAETSSIHKTKQTSTRTAVTRPQIIAIESSPVVPQNQRKSMQIKIKKDTGIDVDKPVLAILKTFSRQANGKRDASDTLLLLSSAPDAKKTAKKKQNIKNVAPVDRPMPAIMKTLAQRAKQKTKTTDNALLASIFGSKKSSDALMAEHRAAEFAMKQRAKAEKDREREHKRQEAISMHQPKSAGTDAPKAVKVNTTIYPLDLRFYDPSHVVGPFSINLSNSVGKPWVPSENLVNAQSHLRAKEKHTGRPVSDEAIDHCPSLCSNIGNRLMASNIDLLSLSLANKLDAPEVKSIDGKLWVDKHSIKNVPEDVIGDSNQSVAREMLRFVDEWKLERQKAHDRRADKQEVLKKKAKNKKRSAQFADDLWGDSDDESSTNNIFLLTGPPGSGKTSLVHAVARQSDCAVIEINTAVRRGGQALKNAISEATQSDSTLEMMKRKNAEAVPIEVLVDSDDDEEEGLKRVKRSAVPVVLIDEVDNLFSEDGDSGFWTALKTVAAKAKCPVFLTANRVPDELWSSSMRYCHYETRLPDPGQCASTLWKFILSEGYRRKSRFTEDDVIAELMNFSELCHFDFRRSLNSLQVILGASYQFVAAADITIPRTNLKSSPTVEIFSISPKQVSSVEPTLLTIKGRGFASMSVLQCSVWIGGGPSLGCRVLNDATILCVCPPCSLPKGVNKYGLFERTFRDCLSCRFASVSVVFESLGVSSSTVSNVRSDEHSDGSIGLKAGVWTIEYCFPGAPRSLRNNHGDSDSIEDPDGDEKEFVSKESRPLYEQHTADDDLASDTPPIDAVEMLNTVRLLIDDAIGALEVPEGVQLVTCDSLCDEYNRFAKDSYPRIEHDAKMAAIDSDLAFLQDGLGGTPFLAGASRGFGPDLVDGGSIESSISKDKKLTRNAKPPSIQLMFGLGWNEESCFFGDADAYMTQPIRGRDRLLLQASVTGSRGMAISLEDRLSSSACPVTEDVDEDGIEQSTDIGVITEQTSHTVPEEDMLLPRWTPPCITEFPAVIMELTSLKRPVGCVADDFLLSRKKSKVALKTQILATVLSDESRTTSFGRGVTRVVDSVLLDDRLDDKMILDYFPFLSKMALSERIADADFNQKSPEEQSSGRRATRRNKKAKRDHYFFKSNVLLREDPDLARDLGSKLADSLLRFRK